MAQRQSQKPKPAKSKTLRKKPILKDNLRSLITFALVFGIVGGAYLIYKSFAATATPIAYVSQIYAAVPGPTVVAKSSKAGDFTWKLPPNTSVSGNIYLPFLKPNSPFSLCADIRSASGGPAGFSLGAAGLGGVDTLKISASKVYHKRCSQMKYIDAYTTSSYRPGISNFSKNKDLYVDWIDFEYSPQYVSGSYTSTVSQ